MNTDIANVNPQLNIQKKSHSLFVLMLGIFMFLIFAREVMRISFPTVILLGWFSVIALMSDRDEFLTLCLVCGPAASAFQYKYALFICMAVYILKFKDDVKMGLCIIPVILMMIWELIHGLFYDLSLVEFFRDFPELIMLTFFMCLKKRETDYVFICRIYGYISCIMGLFVLFSVLKSNGYNVNALFEKGNYRFGMGNKDASQFGLNYNPNGLGILCNCAIISLMIVRYVKKSNIIDYVAIIILVIIGGLTISRTFILTCVVVFLTFAFLGNSSGKGRIKTIFITAILFLVIWFIVANFIPSVYDSFVNRFSADDVTGGRSGLIDFYDEHIYSSWRYCLFGLGLYNVATKINHIYGLVTVVPHNGFQELIVVWGYPGLIMFISMLLCMIRSAGKNLKKYSFVNFIPLGFVMTVALAGQLITSGSKLLMLAFAYMILNVDFKKEAQR